MAAAMAQCVSCSVLPLHLNRLSLTSAPNAVSKSLSFSSSTCSNTLFSGGLASMSPLKMSPGSDRRSLIVRAAEEKVKKPDSAAKRARQAEKRRIYNKSHKSEVRTRMKKVIEALDLLVKKSDPQPEEVIPIEQLIAKAYSVIDKAVKVGTLHRNTGARRKSRLARRKKAVEIHHGWYKPAETMQTV